MAYMVIKATYSSYATLCTDEFFFNDSPMWAIKKRL